MNFFDLNNFVVQEGQKFIFDSNVWISLMPSFSNFTQKNNNYSRLLQNILDKNCEIGILNIEISEIFNVFIRENAKQYFKETGKNNTNSNYKKHYRRSDSFINAKNLILEEIKNIELGYGVKLNDNFNQLADEHIFDKNLNNFDFNDNFICRYCEKYDYIFVTNDRDYKTYSNLNFTVVSAIK